MKGSEKRCNTAAGASYWREAGNKILKKSPDRLAKSESGGKVRMSTEKAHASTGGGLLGNQAAQYDAIDKN